MATRARGKKKARRFSLETGPEFHASAARGKARGILYLYELLAKGQVRYSLHNQTAEVSVNKENRIYARRPTYVPLSKSATCGSVKPQPNAFTLVEVVMAVCLVALLAVVAIPNFLKARATAWQGACVSNLRHIDDAMQQWALENGKSESAAVGFTDISPYLRRSVVCPAGGAAFENSYQVTIVGDTPTCRLLPASHYLPASPFEVAGASSTPMTPPGQGGPPTPPPSNGPGNPVSRPAPPGHGGSNGHGPGHGSGGKLPHAP